MASNAIRPQSIYINSAKVAEVSNSTFDTQANISNQFGAEGVLGQALGAVESKIDFDSIIPVQGTEIDIDALVISQAAITMAVLVNGGLSMVDGRISGSTYTSDAKTGECKGKYTFIGGAPLKV